MGLGLRHLGTLLRIRFAWENALRIPISLAAMPSSRPLYQIAWLQGTRAIAPPVNSEPHDCTEGAEQEVPEMTTRTG